MLSRCRFVLGQACSTKKLTLVAAIVGQISHPNLRFNRTGIIGRDDGLVGSLMAARLRNIVKWAALVMVVLPISIILVITLVVYGWPDVQIERAFAQIAMPTGFRRISKSLRNAPIAGCGVCIDATYEA